MMLLCRVGGSLIIHQAELSARSPEAGYSPRTLTIEFRTGVHFHPRMLLPLERHISPQTYASAQPTCS